ncbi:Hypothetical protein, putative [Bodo saltans]|uniref:Uncharacterized protein n=1 Tax=Bodo saltans TaxID=75058 RepID=A0A0S4ITL8_BODSA|nr:Hypothetical protein, putative [Bodo saltans]|eukprot:CUF86422.1 Hypothetical protein, putative [Bodo saltans]
MFEPLCADESPHPAVFSHATMLVGRTTFPSNDAKTNPNRRGFGNPHEAARPLPIAGIACGTDRQMFEPLCADESPHPAVFSHATMQGFEPFHDEISSHQRASGDNASVLHNLDELRQDHETDHLTCDPLHRDRRLHAVQFRNSPYSAEDCMWSHGETDDAGGVSIAACDSNCLDLVQSACEGCLFAYHQSVAMASESDLTQPHTTIALVPPFSKSLLQSTLQGPEQCSARQSYGLHQPEERADVPVCHPDEISSSLMEAVLPDVDPKEFTQDQQPRRLHYFAYFAKFRPIVFDHRM